MYARKAVKSAKSATTTVNDDFEEVIVDDDGSVYTTEGVFMGNVVDMAGQLTSEGPSQSQTSSQAASAEAFNAPRSAPESEAVGTSLRADVLTSSDEAMGFSMDESFYGGFIPQACVGVAQSDELNDMLVDELVEHTGGTRLPRRRPALMVAGSVAFVMALAAPRNTAKLLFVLSMASFAAAYVPKVAVLSVQSSLLSPQTDPNTAALNSRTGAAIDTGASMHVSGRKELFPPPLIVDHHPLIKVQIANDIKCSVEFRGTMRIPVKFRAGIGTTTATDGWLMLSNSLYVPELRDNTLLSPRAMFHDHSMRTYFNDDRFIRTAKGQLIDFTETSTLYSIRSAVREALNEDGAGAGC